MSDETPTTPETDDVDGHKLKTPVYEMEDAPADEDDVAGHLKYGIGKLEDQGETVETNINWRQGHGGAPD
jgi:hypothetical protein